MPIADSPSAAQRWRAMVEAEHAQSESARGAPPPEDHWVPFTRRFRQDPRRADDPTMQRLLQEVMPDATVLDVGAGAGRFALPLALHSRHVTAVEPSPAMVVALQEDARSAGIRNLTVVQARWEEAQVEPADLVLCSHVVYAVWGIEPFLRKLEAFARSKVLLLVFAEPALAHVAPFWKRVHGQERLRLPCLKELLEVLWELGVYPDVEMAEPEERVPFRSLEEARETLRLRLYLHPGSSGEGLLEQAMAELLEETPTGLRVRGAPAVHQALVSWSPVAQVGRG